MESILEAGDRKLLTRLAEGEHDYGVNELFKEVPFFDLTEVGGF